MTKVVAAPRVRAWARRSQRRNWAVRMSRALNAQLALGAGSAPQLSQDFQQSAARDLSGRA